MKIKKLEINNFRVFRQATVEFPESNLAVFIGVNGQGKSSLLDLVAMFLNYNSIILTTRDLSSAVYRIYPSDINLKSDASYNRAYFDTGHNNIVEAECHAENLDSKHGIGLDSLGYFTQELRSEIIANKETASISTLLYYRANRFFDNNYESSNEEQTYEAPQFAAYENAFSKKITNFTEFVNWFRNEEDKENELIKKERNFDATNPRLQVIRKAISTFFHHLQEPSYGNLRVERELPKAFNFALADFSSSLRIFKNDQDLRLEQLSDGEKMLLMVVCDIARRLSIANPGLSNPLEGRGIVLIDEIELHLHPKWQREVIPALLATFPNIQFLLSTHSPQVLSSVDSEDIFLLKDGEVLKLSSNPKGMDTNAILEEVMDTPKYPKHMAELVEKLFTLVQKRQFGPAMEVRQQIVEETSPDYPILRQADSMMERLKVLSQ